jgi:hypothetical protein
MVDRFILNSTHGESARHLPNSKLITETWKIIDIKSITKKDLLLEEIEEAGMD